MEHRDKKTFTLPRLYSAETLTANAPLTLDDAQGHYLRTVLRRQAGDKVRIFNGRNGEWLAAITELGKKSASLTLQQQILPQPPPTGCIHLLFAPLKKDRLDFMIEKSVELGVTDFHPIITNRTEIRTLKTDRIEAQIIEASEQCERLTIPILHPITPLMNTITAWTGPKPILWCRERGANAHISSLKQQDWAFIIGPVGGFDDREDEVLARTPGVTPVSLGQTVFRAETAAILCLSHARITAGN